MVALANFAEGIVPRNLVGVEAAAANAYLAKRQAETTSAPAGVQTITTFDNAGAITTLLSAYMSANPSLQTANADIISLISSFAIAQESYNAALSRGETPSPPILALPGTSGTATITATGTNAATGSNATPTSGVARSTSTGTTRLSTTSTTSTAGGTGAANRTLATKMGVAAICGLIAMLVVSV